VSDASTRGLYGKFIVKRSDGTDAPGEKHDGCTYFVLDLEHDKHAASALRAYARSCAKSHPQLARDLVAVADGNKLVAQKPSLSTLSASRMSEPTPAESKLTPTTMCPDGERHVLRCIRCEIPASLTPPADQEPR